MWCDIRYVFLHRIRYLVAPLDQLILQNDVTRLSLLLPELFQVLPKVLYDGPVGMLGLRFKVTD